MQDFCPPPSFFFFFAGGRWRRLVGVLLPYGSFSRSRAVPTNRRNEARIHFQANSSSFATKEVVCTYHFLLLFCVIFESSLEPKASPLITPLEQVVAIRLV